MGRLKALLRLQFWTLSYLESMPIPNVEDLPCERVVDFQIIWSEQGEVTELSYHKLRVPWTHFPGPSSGKLGPVHFDRACKVGRL